jgi:UrcA family protein
MYIRHILLVAAVSLAALSSAASANSVTHIVRYSDLNLNSEAGRATLDRRINRAARVVCGSPSTAALQDKLNVEKCYAAARASAEAQLNIKS